MTGTQASEEHVLVADLLPLAAVGALDSDEFQQVERHLATCPECRSELDALNRTKRSLQTSTLSRPPENLWSRIEAQITEAAPPVPASNRWLGAGRYSLGMAAGLALILAVASAGVTYLLMRSDGNSQASQLQNIPTNDVVFTLAALNPGAAAEGRIFMSQSRTQGVVAVSGLEQLAAGEKYAVWIVRDDNSRLSAGTFSVDGSGNAIAALSLPSLPYDWENSGKYVALSISRVDSSDMSKPVGGPILVGPLY